MRPVINKVNELNPNIVTIPVKFLKLQFVDSTGTVSQQRNLKLSGWLDLAKEQLSFILLPPEDVLIKISYQLIFKFHLATRTNTAQVFFFFIKII
jgi:hypothetical protein